MSTFLTIYTTIANQFDSQSVARCKEWANEAAHEFYDRRKFAWREAVATFATVAGQQDYVLAGAAPVVPDFDGFISARHNNANASTSFGKLKEMYQDDFDEWFAFCGPTAGIPFACTVRGATPAASSSAVHSGGEQVLSLQNVPPYIGSLKLAYVRAAGSIEMVNDADVPLAPVQYHRAIIDLAISIGLTSEDQMIQASTFQQRAETMIASAVAADVALRPSARTKQSRDPRQPPASDPRQGPPYGFDEDR